jgi:hypothetical protein
VEYSFASYDGISSSFVMGNRASSPARHVFDRRRRHEWNHLAGCRKIASAPQAVDGQQVWIKHPARMLKKAVQQGRSEAHDATNKEHHVCARRRVGEAAGSPLGA